MKQSLMKLVDVILQKIDARPDSIPSESGIRSWLSGQGYGKRDIEAAMKLIRPRLLSKVRADARPVTSIRSFSTFENYKLSPEARNALVRLDLYGLISPIEREMVLERLGFFEGEVGIEEIDYLLAMVLNERDIESQHTICDVLEDTGNMLH